MVNKILSSRKFVYCVIVLLLVTIFCAVYGVYVLNPTYTDWLLTNVDASQHYLGWKAYRLSNWRFPIGSMDYLAYPNVTSIIFTDSIPLLAVIFKVLSPFLPAEFQYFGLWGMLCFVLQGIFAARILQRFTDNKVMICLMSIFMAFSPVIFWRLLRHSALAGHWILLAALDTIFGYDKNVNSRKIFVIWGVLGVLAASIHIYFLLMCGIVLVGYCIQDIISRRKVWKGLVLLLVYVLPAAAMVGLLGGFSTGFSATTANELGVYSANLNSFVNPHGMSEFVKNLSTVGLEQGEGFGYLGIGCMLLIPISIFAMANHSDKKEFLSGNRNKIVALAAVFAIAFLVAVFPKLSLGENVLLEIPASGIIAGFWSIFRASGRVIWLAVYILMCCSCIVICKVFNEKAAVAVIAVCLYLQVVDLAGNLTGFNATFNQNIEIESVQRQDVFWKNLAENQSIKHIIFTESVNDLGYENIYMIVDWALSSGKTVNDFYFARELGEAVSTNTEEKLQNPSHEDVFIFFKDNPYKCYKYNLNYYLVGDYIVGYKGQLSDAEPFSTDVVNYEVDFTENDYIKLGFDQDGVRHLYPGGHSYGPYWYLPAGSYKITINGANMDKATFTVCSGATGEIFEHIQVNGVSVEAVLTLELKEDVKDFEVVVINNTKEGIIISDIRLEGTVKK